MHNIYICLLAMAIATYAIRVLPLTLIRKEITNKYIKSFLYYVPYVTLAVMTFPAIINATHSPIAGNPYSHTEYVVRSDCINWCDSFGLERWKSFSGCNSKLCAGIYCGIDNCLRSK